MSEFDKARAGADLAAIDDVVARVKQSRIYRVAGDVAIFWGFMQFAQWGVASLSPANGGWSWFAVDLVGVALTVVMLRRALPAPLGAVGAWRQLAAFALFYGFGFVWSVLLGHFGGRETSVFWHTLFLFGYCLAGLWFGVGFLVIGLSLSALVLAVYAFVQPPLFWLLIALVTGLGYIVCGLWMRRA
jgi:hypothetical protein